MTEVLYIYYMILVQHTNIHIIYFDRELHALVLEYLDQGVKFIFGIIITWSTVKWVKPKISLLSELI